MLTGKFVFSPANESCMKRFLPVLLFLAFSLLTNAQPLRYSLALQSGVSIPLFDFAAKDLQKGSFTLPGFTGSVEMKAMFSEKWGGLVHAGLQFNPVDVGMLGLAKAQADPFIEDMYIRSEAFRVIHLLAGPDYQLRLGKSLLLDGRLTAGVILASTPYQLYKTTFYQIGLVYYEITTSRDLSFAYSAGLSLTWELTPCYQLGISSQYIQSRAGFLFTSGSGERTDYRNINLWNNSLALIIRL